MVTLWNRLARGAFGILLLCCMVLQAQATPITVSAPFNIREARQPNTAGLVVGNIVRVGALSVIPNGFNGTVGVATQTDANGNVTASLNLTNVALSGAPNFFVGPTLIDADPDATDVVSSLSDPWTMTFTNGGDVTSVVTQAAAATAPPFVNSLKIFQNGTTPTFNWNNPGVLYRT